MVELNFTGYCKGCKYADLEFVDYSLYSGDEIAVHTWEVKCNHEKICQKWNREFRMKTPLGEEGDKNET